MHPQDYNPGYSSVGYIPSPVSKLKRKRDCDGFIIDNDEVREGYHSHKKHHVDVRPLTPTSPPLSSSLSSIQTLSPPSNDDQHVYQHAKQDISAIHSHDNNTRPSEAQIIPSQNLFLRNIHMKSRIYIQNQPQPENDDDKNEEMDEEMWEEEEEIVAERYAAMNKLLGSRKMHR